jgi:hypothetical protein
MDLVDEVVVFCKPTFEIFQMKKIKLQTYLMYEQVAGFDFYFDQLFDILLFEKNYILFDTFRQFYLF